MNKIKNKIWLFLFILPFGCIGQTFQPKQIDYEGKGIIYNKEFALDFKLHTNGFAFGTKIGKLKTYYKTNYLSFELGELKHPKEFRQNVENFSTFPSISSRSFVFGKQNNFYVLRSGFGVKRYLSEKARYKGVAVGIAYEAGPSLGFLKPYYLELRRTRENQTGSGSQFEISTEKYTVDNQDIFLDRNKIFGAAPLVRGFNELGIRPGIHGKFSFHFDWGAFDEIVKALELGLMADFYFSEIPILVESENVSNQVLFLNLYISLQFGKRW